MKDSLKKGKHKSLDGFLKEFVKKLLGELLVEFLGNFRMESLQ